MDDAGLHRRLGKDGMNGVRKALQAIHDGHEDVLDTAVLQLVHDAQPELRALVLLEPQAEDLLAAVGSDAEGDVHRLVPDEPLVADLHPQGVEEDQRIGRIERPGLPGCDVFQNGVRDGADEIGRDVDAVEIVQVADDLPGAHPAGVHRDDLVVEARKPALVLGDELRVKARLPVARHLELDPAVSVMTVFLP